MTLDESVAEKGDNWEQFEPVSHTDTDSATDETRRVPEMDIYQNHLKQYELFKSLYGDPKMIFYPCCGCDGTPIAAFPESHLTYLDFYIIPEMFKGENIETIVGIVEGHEPEQKYDLVIILNPGMDESHSIRSEVLTKHLAQGRYVIANNRHGNAKELFYDDRFGNVGRFTAQGKACSLEANFDDIDETPWSDSPNYVFRKL